MNKRPGDSKRHVNCYITKPVDLEEFMDAAKTLRHSWFNAVKSPQAE